MKQGLFRWNNLMSKSFWCYYYSWVSTNLFYLSFSYVISLVYVSFHMHAYPKLSSVIITPTVTWQLVLQLYCIVKGKAVIELGCGLGVPSCAAAFAGAAEVGSLLSLSCMTILLYHSMHHFDVSLSSAMCFRPSDILHWLWWRGGKCGTGLGLSKCGHAISE